MADLSMNEDMLMRLVLAPKGLTNNEKMMGAFAGSMSGMAGAVIARQSAQKLVDAREEAQQTAQNLAVAENRIRELEEEKAATWEQLVAKFKTQDVADAALKMTVGLGGITQATANKAQPGYRDKWKRKDWRALLIP